MEKLLKSTSKATTAEQLMDLDTLEEALAVRAAYLVKETFKKIEGSTAALEEKTNSLFAVEIVSMVRAHLTYATFHVFYTEIKALKTKDPKIKENLFLLCQILGLYELLNDSAVLYETGYFKPGSGQLVLDGLKELLVKLRPQMIPLVETFNWSDSMLVSAIGNKYGDIYEQQLEWARNSRLNKNQVLPGFKEHLLPIVQGKL